MKIENIEVAKAKLERLEKLKSMKQESKTEGFALAIAVGRKYSVISIEEFPSLYKSFVKGLDNEIETLTQEISEL